MRKLAYLSILLIFSYCSSDSDSAEVVVPPTLNYTLSVTAGEGGSVSSAGGSYKSGQVVIITATANSEYVFSGWSNGSNDNPLTVTMNSNQVISASFDKKKYTLTISKEQFDFVQSQIIKKNLQGKVNVIYRDYREHQGEYSRIYSIEMFEAVGMQYWQAYFDKVKDLLKPSGIFSMQTIVIFEGLFEKYSRKEVCISLKIYF